jgi:hypothetical protein
MFGKFLHSALVGLIAGVAVYSANVFSMTGWILFMAWISYFLFGPSFTRAMWAMAQMLVGVLLSVGVIAASQALAPAFGMWGNIGVVVLLVTALGFLEDVPPINVIPSYYIGLVIFIATGSSPELKSLPPVIIPIVAGFAFGWITVASRAWLSRVLASRGGQANADGYLSPLV